MTTFAVDRDHPSFAGHFPGEPVLPGVVILTEAIAQIARATTTHPAQWTLERVKFHATVGPDVTLRIIHEAHGEQSHHFEVREGRRLITSGTLARRAP